MTAPSWLCAGRGGGIMGPSFCPPEPNLSNFPTPAALPAAGGGGGREGRERSEMNRCGTAGARQNARNATILPSACVYGVTKRRSHLTRTFPCILAVSIRLFSFILPPSFLPIRHRALRTGAVWDRCCLLGQPATSQPASQSSRQRVSS